MSKILAMIAAGAKKRKKDRGNYYAEYLSLRTEDLIKDTYTLSTYPWIFWLFGSFTISCSIFCAYFIFKYSNFDESKKTRPGLMALLQGRIHRMKYDKARKILKLYKVGMCSKEKSTLKRSQLKDIKIIMKGGIEGYHNDIHYVIQFEGIRNKSYQLFDTGDRKKAKERYYEIRTALGFQVDLEKANIEKKLRNISEEDMQEFFFEEDRALVSTRKRKR